MGSETRVRGELVFISDEDSVVGEEDFEEAAMSARVMLKVSRGPVMSWLWCFSLESSSQMPIEIQMLLSRYKMLFSEAIGIYTLQVCTTNLSNGANPH